MIFWDKFVILCKEKGESPTAVTKKLGLSTSSVTGWKSGQIPRYKTMLKIAEYLNVSTSELYSDTEPVVSEPESSCELSELDEKLLDMFHKLSYEAQMQEIGRLTLLAEMGK